MHYYVKTASENFHLFLSYSDCLVHVHVIKIVLPTMIDSLKYILILSKMQNLPFCSFSCI